MSNLENSMDNGDKNIAVAVNNRRNAHTRHEEINVTGQYFQEAKLTWYCGL